MGNISTGISESVVFLDKIEKTYICRELPVVKVMNINLLISMRNHINVGLEPN